MERSRHGLALVPTAPANGTIADQDPTFAVANVQGSGAIITFDNTLGWANECQGFMFTYQGMPQGAQRNFFGGPWRDCGWLQGNDVAPPASGPEQPLKWPTFTGQRMWVYARISREDGRLSEPMRADCIVT